MKPVRVLQILTCDGLGGTEMMVATLVERLDRSAVVPTVVTLDAPGPISARLEQSGLSVRSLGSRGLPVAFARLGLILNRERFDVVNAYGFKSTAVVRGLVRVLSPGTRFVSGVRGLHVAELEDIDGLKSRALLALERAGSPLVHAYDANSRGALELLARTGVDRRRLHYIPNGIDVERWPDVNSNGRRPGPPVIMSVARFVPIKRHVDLIDATDRLAKAGLDFRLLMVGGGPTLAQTVETARRLGLTEEIAAFPGSVGPDQVRELTAESHIFCLASLWEGMAGSVMEAMASGLPVVGTRVNGIADLVEDGRTGVLVPPRRPDLLAEALASLVNDPTRAAELGAAGRQRIRKEFDVERMVGDKARLFLNLAARN